MDRIIHTRVRPFGRATVCYYEADTESVNTAGKLYRRQITHNNGDLPAIFPSDDERSSSNVIYYTHGRMHRDGGKPADIGVYSHTFYEHGKEHRDGNLPSHVEISPSLHDTARYYYQDGRVYASGEERPLPKANDFHGPVKHMRFCLRGAEARTDGGVTYYKYWSESELRNVRYTAGIPEGGLFQSRTIIEGVIVEQEGFPNYERDQTPLSAAPVTTDQRKRKVAQQEQQRRLRLFTSPA